MPPRAPCHVPPHRTGTVWPPHATRRLKRSLTTRQASYFLTRQCLVRSYGSAMANRERAIVVGGGVAGLACAACLREHFDEVLILDQGDPPRPDTVRRHAPQGAHFHYLVRGGLLALEELLPGIRDSLQEGVHHPSDSIGDVLIYLRGEYRPRFASERRVYFQTRPQLEAKMQRYVAALGGVSFRYGVKVTGIVADHLQNRVGGVTVGDETILASLIVDATGRGTRFPEWLGCQGFERAPVDRVNIELGYATRLYRRSGGSDFNFDLHFQAGSPERQSRGAALCRLGPEDWQLTLVGYGEGRPPADEQGFEDFLEQLPADAVAVARRTLVPKSAISTYQFKASLWRRYDLLRSPPAGFLAIGDAVCSVDPKFGHGMSKAIQEALTLRNLLRRRIPVVELPGLQYRRARRHTLTPWLIAAAEGFQMKHVTGDTPPGLGLLQWYLGAMVDASAHSRTVHEAAVDILALERPLEAGLHPRILSRVMLHRLRALARRVLVRGIVPSSVEPRREAGVSATHHDGPP